MLEWMQLKRSQHTPLHDNLPCQILEATEARQARHDKWELQTATGIVPLRPESQRDLRFTLQRLFLRE